MNKKKKVMLKQSFICQKDKSSVPALKTLKPYHENPLNIAYDKCGKQKHGCLEHLSCIKTTIPKRMKLKERLFDEEIKADKFKRLSRTSFRVPENKDETKYFKQYVFADYIWNRQKTKKFRFGLIENYSSRARVSPFLKWYSKQMELISDNKDIFFSYYFPVTLAAHSMVLFVIDERNVIIAYITGFFQNTVNNSIESFFYPQPKRKLQFNMQSVATHVKEARGEGLCSSMVDAICNYLYHYKRVEMIEIDILINRFNQAASFMCYMKSIGQYYPLYSKLTTTTSLEPEFLEFALDTKGTDFGKFYLHNKNLNPYNLTYDQILDSYPNTETYLFFSLQYFDIDEDNVKARSIYDILRHKYKSRKSTMFNTQRRSQSSSRKFVRRSK